MLKVHFSKEYSYRFTDFTKNETPAFASYIPDIKGMKEFSRRYLKYKNIVVAARGGSITSFRAYFGALKKLDTKKRVYFVDTEDPEFLSYVKKNCKVSDTIVIVISKSGETIDVIENYLFFQDYKCLFITTKNDNTLHKIAKKRNIPVLPHPEIGGRYSGLTATALVPAFLVGLDIGKLSRGALKAYKDFSTTNKKNLAIQTATWVYENEKRGLVDVYMPIYSSLLSDFSELILQLIHESVGKEGRGPSVIAVSAPESQHHSNQRYFGGRKNIQGFFISCNKSSSKESIHVGKDIEDLKIRGNRLLSIDGLSLLDAMKAELEGSFADSVERGVPAISLIIDKIDEESIGYFTGFLHYFTVYLSWLNKVNPFDQPEVETSKEISFKARLLKK